VVSKEGFMEEKKGAGEKWFGKEGPDPSMLDVTTVVRIHDELCLPPLTTTLIPCKDKLKLKEVGHP
jgi:hypothetical protein